MATTVRERINAFVTLLSIPNPNSPANTAAAVLYKESLKDYNRKALRIFRGFDKQ
jgi:ubiquitin-protein ligase